jgi:hypothetical protein
MTDTIIVLARRGRTVYAPNGQKIPECEIKEGKPTSDAISVPNTLTIHRAIVAGDLYQFKEHKPLLEQKTNQPNEKARK